MQFVLRLLVLRLWTLLYKITVIEFSSAMAATSTVHWESNTFSASLTSVKEWSRKSAAIPVMLETSFTISYSMHLWTGTSELFIIRNSPNPFEWIHRGCLKRNVLGCFGDRAYKRISFVDDLMWPSCWLAGWLAGLQRLILWPSYSINRCHYSNEPLLVAQNTWLRWHRSKLISTAQTNCAPTSYATAS